jgi:uncharacterized protein (DUF2236 family)
MPATSAAGTLFPTDGEAERLLVGPDSVTWQRASDARLYLVMLYPLLLQVAHPTVGAGVRDYSDFESRPWDRLWRTLDYVSLIVYGGHEAIATGRRLRSLHKSFTGIREDGERYYALEPKAYAWVHATLLETYVAGHAQFGTPLTQPEIERFYQEYRGLGRLVGVRERDLPKDWSGFRTYFDEMVGTQLVRTVSVDRVIRSVKKAANPLPPLPEPVWRAMSLPASKALWLGGIGLMDPTLRDRLGIGFSRAEQRAFDAIGTVSRTMTPVMPKRLKVVGPAQLRMRRRAIDCGPLGPLGPQAEAA